jgi:hypothetical protein
MDSQIIAAAKPLMAQARPRKPAPFLPMSRAEMTRSAGMNATSCW